MIEQLIGITLGIITGAALCYSLHHFYRWAIWGPESTNRDPRLMLLIALASTSIIILAALSSIGILGE